MAKKYGYVVMQTHYAYNDQTYYQEGDESGTPVKIFSDKKAADATAERLQKEFWKKNDPIEYGEDLEELFNAKILEPFVLAGKTSTNDWYDFSDAEKKLLTENCTVSMFYVQKVEYE